MKKNTVSFFISICSIGLAIFAMLISGCSTVSQKGRGDAAESSSSPPTAVAQNGPQLWAQNCIHCHNIRSPSSYSDAQWEVVMLHMRIRANLTANEHKAILAFLKSAH